jgi:hypothetical protein
MGVIGGLFRPRDNAELFRSEHNHAGGASSVVAAQNRVDTVPSELSLLREVASASTDLPEKLQESIIANLEQFVAKSEESEFYPNFVRAFCQISNVDILLVILFAFGRTMGTLIRNGNRKMVAK